MPKRSNLKGPGRCIFCGSYGLTKEHIWPQWSFKYVPKGPNTTHVRGLVQSSKGSPRIKGVRRIKQHNGPVNTIQLRVVCRTRCNSGWMSILETRAKPILIPLMLGEPLVLAPENQRTLARWFTLKVMVAEFSEPEALATQQSERDHLMFKDEPPSNWQIWIGHKRGPDWRVKYTRSAMTLGIAMDDGPLIPPDGDYAKNAKAVTMGIGELLLYAVATPPGIGVRFDGNLTEPLRRIWPTSGGIVWPPGKILTDRDCNVVASSLDRFSETLPWQPAPESASAIER